MFTQEQKNFLTRSNLQQLDIWVDFSEHKFYIQDSLALYDLTAYIKLKIGKLAIISPIPGGYLTSLSHVVPHIIQLSNIDKMDERLQSFKLTYDEEGILLDNYLDTTYTYLRDVIISECLINIFEYGFWNERLSEFVLNEDSTILPYENIIFSEDRYSNFDIYVNDDCEDTGDTENILRGYEDVWERFNFSEEQLNTYLNGSALLTTEEVNYNIEQIKSILNLYYKDKYDLNLTTKEVILHWDKVEIRNSQGSSHTMYDFYIKLDFNSNFNKVENMQGLRASFTLKEYWNNNPYTFSHLGTNVFGQWGSLCLGSTPLSDMYAILQTNEFSLIVFEAFVLQLNEYVRWESLEGGPYRSSNIGKIAYKSSTNNILNYNLNHLDSSKISTIINLMYPVIELELKQTITGNVLKLKQTPLLEKAIHQVCVKKALLSGVVGTQPYEQYKNFSTGEYFNESDLICNNDNAKLKVIYFEEKKKLEVSNFQSNSLFNFNGNKIYKKLIPEHFEDDSIELESLKTTLSKVLNPKIYNYIVDKINDKLFTLTIKKLNEQYINNKQRELITS